MAESLVLHGIAGLKVLSSINRVPDGMGPEVEEALTQNLRTFIEMRNKMKTTVGWKRNVLQNEALLEKRELENDVTDLRSRIAAGKQEGRELTAQRASSKEELQALQASLEAATRAVEETQEQGNADLLTARNRALESARDKLSDAEAKGERLGRLVSQQDTQMNQMEIRLSRTEEQQRRLEVTAEQYTGAFLRLIDNPENTLDSVMPYNGCEYHQLVENRDPHVLYQATSAFVLLLGSHKHRILDVKIQERLANAMDEFVTISEIEQIGRKTRDIYVFISESQEIGTSKWDHVACNFFNPNNRSLQKAPGLLRALQFASSERLRHGVEMETTAEELFKALRKEWVAAIVRGDISPRDRPLVAHTPKVTSINTTTTNNSGAGSGGGGTTAGPAGGGGGGGMGTGGAGITSMRCAIQHNPNNTQHTELFSIRNQARRPLWWINGIGKAWVAAHPAHPGVAWATALGGGAGGGGGGGGGSKSNKLTAIPPNTCDFCRCVTHLEPACPMLVNTVGAARVTMVENIMRGRKEINVSLNSMQERARLHDLGADQCAVSPATVVSDVRPTLATAAGIGGTCKMEQEATLVVIADPRVEVSTLILPASGPGSSLPFDILSVGDILNQRSTLGVYIEPAPAGQHVLEYKDNGHVVLSVPESSVHPALFIDRGGETDRRALTVPSSDPLTMSCNRGVCTDSRPANAPAGESGHDEEVEDEEEEWLVAVLCNMLAITSSEAGTQSVMCPCSVDANGEHHCGSDMAFNARYAAFLEKHEDLGHASLQKMKKVRKTGRIKGLNWDGVEFPPDAWKCQTCMKARAAIKAHHKPAPARSKATRFAQTISSDSMGKFEVSDEELDYLFAQMMIDHYSNYIIAIPLEHKGQVAVEVVHELAMINKTDPVETFRSDGDASQDNAFLQGELRKLHIKFDIVGTYDPAANGKVERSNRTIFDILRPQLIASGEPIASWAYAIRLAARQHNIMPSDKDGTSPWEKRFKEQPDGSNVHAFGRRGIALIPDPDNKFTARGKLAKYYGLSEDSQTTMLVRVQTKDGRQVVIPTRTFRPIPLLGSPEKDEQDWEFDASKVQEQYDVVGRLLTTDLHHEMDCHACNAGGNVLCCDYCDRVWHKRCVPYLAKGKKNTKQEIGLLRCPECRKKDLDAVVVADMTDLKRRARERNETLAETRRDDAAEAVARKAVARHNKTKAKENKAAARLQAAQTARNAERDSRAEWARRVASHRQAAQAAEDGPEDISEDEAQEVRGEPVSARLRERGKQVKAFIAHGRATLAPVPEHIAITEAQQAEKGAAIRAHLDAMAEEAREQEQGAPYPDWIARLGNRYVPIIEGRGVFVSSTIPATTPIIIPQGFQQATSSPEAEQWQAAMDAELETIGGHLEVRERAEAVGFTVLGNTWVYSTKPGLEGTLEFKARLTIMGNMQAADDINPDHRSSPTVDQVSHRLILATLANMPGAQFLSFDFVRAYLQAKRPATEKNIFMRFPKGWKGDTTGKILLVTGNLYGLVEAAWNWWNELSQGMAEKGWEAGKTDPCTWRRTDEATGAVVAYTIVHVDDGMMMGYNVLPLFEEIAKKYEIKLLGKPKSFLGVEYEFQHNGDGGKTGGGMIFCHQKSYKEWVLDHWENHPIMPMPTIAIRGQPTTRVPLSPNTDLRNKEGALTEVIDAWQEFMGHVRWIHTMPEGAYALLQLSYGLTGVTQTMKNAAHDLLKYIAGNLTDGLVYGKNPRLSDTTVVFADAEFGHDHKTGQAIYGGVILCKGGLIDYKSASQKCVTLSSTEAETVAASKIGQRNQKCRAYQVDQGRPPIGPSPFLRIIKEPWITHAERHLQET